MKKLSKKLLALLLVFAMLIPTGALMVNTSAEDENDGIVEFNGHYYKAFEEKMLWTEAKEYCESIGGHLATITSAEENEFVYSLAKENYYLLGGTDQNEEGAWEWISGEEWDYVNWYGSEPNNGRPIGREQDCLAMYGQTDYRCSRWDDACIDDESFFICEWDSEGDVPGEHSPDGYDFETDRWNFRNINETIALDYYIGLYEEQKGTELYNFRGEKVAHGHCFGMATSTVATLINAPYVTDYISWTGLPYTKLSSVNKGTMNIDMDISAKDYIKYCHIYQNSAYVARQRNSESNSGISNVYNAVKNAALTNTDCTLIVIDLWGGSGGHSVYAAGIDGNDIIVNDSNTPGSLQRIKINGDSWTYSAAGNHWDSSVDATINYVENCIEPYLRLTWNIDVEGGNIPKDSESSFLYTEESEINGTNSCYSSYIEPIDTDKLLVVSESDSFAFDESESMYRVMFADGDTTDNTDGLYWLDSGDTINAENVSDESATLKLVGNEMKITAEMPVDSSVEMVVNEDGNNKAVFDVNDNDEVVVTFTSLDENKEFINTTLTGTANGDEVVASETEDGIQVTGLNDITVTYETPDGTAETKADVKDGSTVNITVSDDENKIETDWQDKDETDEECKHPDTDHNGICDACSEDFTKGCSCNCHGNAFMQFLYKIATFFRRLFGMKQYQYCDCGKAHW